MQAPEIHELAVLEQLRLALVGHDFVLFAQPITPLRSGDQVQHLEVLLRLVGEDSVILPPACFLPVAERHGLVSQIDRWVAHHALIW